MIVVQVANLGMGATALVLVSGLIGYALGKAVRRG